MKLTRSTGLSLIELLVGTAIGLSITVAAINYLTTNLKTRNVNAAYSNMKDNGSIALHFLARHTRGAGAQTVPVNGSKSISSGNCETEKAWCTLESKSEPDRLAVRMVYPYESQACNGETALENSEIVEIFSILKSQDYSALVCQTYDLSNNAWLGSDQKRVLQTGIEDLQVEFYIFGQATPVNASAVSDWSLVQGIEVNVIATSEYPAHMESTAQTLISLDSNNKYYNDRFARHIFGTTIAFNNQLLAETN